MIEQRVFAGDLTLAHAFLAHESANAGIREVDLVEGCAREGPSCLVLEVPHVLLSRGDVAGIACVIGVGRADDRRVEPRDHEEEPPVTLREQDVRLLDRPAGDDVHAFRQTEEWVGPLAKRRDRTIEPWSGRDDRETCADLDVSFRAGVADTRSDDAIPIAKKIDNPRVIEHNRLMVRGVDEVLDDEPFDERDLRVVEAPRADEAIGLERRLGGERRGTVKVLPPRQALVERERVVELHSDPEL